MEAPFEKIEAPFRKRKAPFGKIEAPFRKRKALFEKIKSLQKVKQVVLLF